MMKLFHAIVLLAFFQVDVGQGYVSGSFGGQISSSQIYSSSSSSSINMGGWEKSSSSIFVSSGEGSGNDELLSKIFRPETLTQDETLCGPERAGVGCKYTLYQYTSAVPSSQWGKASTSSLNNCYLSGEGDLATLDGAAAHFQGNCEVLAVGQCSDADGFMVWITRDSPSIVSKVRVKQGDTEIILREVITVNGKEISAPYSSGKFDISKQDASLTVTFDGNAYVYYNNAGSWVSFSVPKSYVTCGLCGNQNGDESDDTKDDKITPSFIEKSVSDRNCVNVPTTNRVAEIEECTNRNSVHQICNVLISSVFRGCMTKLSPKVYYQLCLRKLCMDDFEARDDILCGVVSEYARQCSLNYGRPGNWRSVTNCIQRCSPGMKWSACRDSSRTCAAYGSKETATSCGSYTCFAGCECVKGTYLQDGVCVRADQCRCEMKSKYYEPGQVINKECNNTCTCQAGHWKCTENQCTGVAEITGYFRYATFDGRRFQHPANCRFVFAQDKGRDFQVLVDFEQRDGVFYKYPIIRVKEGTGYNEYILKRNGDIMKNGKRLSVPINSGIVDIQTILGSVMLTIKGKGVEILYDRIATIAVKVSPNYLGKMIGLAGNYNGIQSDDMLLRSGCSAQKIAVFVQDWKDDKKCDAAIPGIPPNTVCDSKASNICNKMLSVSGCWAIFDRVIECRKDMCSLPESERMTYACSIQSGLRAACTARTTSSFNLISTLDGECTPQCVEPKVYRLNNECLDSCSSFSTSCTFGMHEGCFCPEGHYENDQGECVSMDDCPCLYEGTWYEQGTTNIDDKECTCKSGAMECISKNETTTCTGVNEQYYSCEDPWDIQGAACEGDCGNLESFCVAGACATGCACKPGFYRSQEGSCVLKEECGCFDGEKYFKHGQWYMDDCNKVTCSGGLFKRTNLICPRTCWAVGASHYKSFDGLRYDYEGDCEYILATDYCPNNPNQGLFSVITSNTRCGSNGMTCSKSIVINVKNQRIILQRGKEVIIETVGGEKTPEIGSINSGAITGDTDHSVAETFTIKQKGLFTVIDTCIGMTVLWDNGTRVYIRLTEEFQRTTCGLCGNFDGVDENDLVQSTGLKTKDILEFGNSWKFTAQRAACPDTTLELQANATCSDVTRRDWANKKCGTLIDPNGPFAACHAVVNPQTYFDICVYDTCGCNSGGDCECLCTAIAHYAHTCANKGAVVEWRTNDLCPIMCEQYNDNEDICLWHYRPCATCITDTCCECLQPVDTQWCVEGCFPKCPSGYILDEMTQKCILATQRETNCTWFSRENMCHTCEKCDVCKTPSGAVLRVEPGQTVYFPYDTDSCLVEWCAADTTGDLCYNGTVELYECDDYPIPSYDDRFYTQTCWNSTTSDCKNCRECRNECKVRDDSCDVGKTPEDLPWRKVFPVLPTPERGAKTYCMEYSCENHPLAIEPQCFIQREERVVCAQNIDDVICKDHEVLKIRATGDECCPEEYYCFCETCTMMQDGEMVLMPHILPGETNEWCENEDESNCCYTDTCTDNPKKRELTECPVVTRVQAPCTTGPAPTCEPGYVWVNKTRSGDCCPWGICECDCCYDYNELNVKSLRLIGDQWTKKCMRFTCERNTHDSNGCFETRNYENITCSTDPECGYNERLSFVKMDATECCEIKECVCYSNCRVTIDGKVKVYEIGDEFIGASGCWQRCVNGSKDTNCPVPIDICQKPDKCGECQVIAQVVKDTCGCDQNDCQYIEKCPSISCPQPFVRKINESADICKSPCYYCGCDECWDQYQNKTYPIGTEYVRRETDPIKCYDCVCTEEMDIDKCPKEVCNPQPCKEVEKCPNPYETPIIGQDECGCDILVRCECNRCMMNGEVLEDKEIGERWTIGNMDLGCYDTYQCLHYRAPNDCYNVTKERAVCTTIAECQTGFKLVEDESQSCYYDDGEYCARKSCTCDNCRFDGKFYAPGSNWTKDCIEYTCTDQRDPNDPDECYLVQSKVQDCPSPDLNCVNCYVEYLKQRRDVPEYCCDVWDCKPELFCIDDETGERVPNGTIWKPSYKDCLKLQCIVSDTAWANGTCPEIKVIEYCEEDTTTCGECQNRTIVKDECDCPVVECKNLDEPVSCTKPAENQLIEYFNTGDNCFPSKNCCVCDSACFNGDSRQELFSVWRDTKTCKRLRCVLPDATLSALGFDPKKIDYYDLADIATFSDISTKLNYRKLLSDSKIAKSLYSQCSQDISLCPTTFDLGCPKPIECALCEKTIESVDDCGCPVVSCEPLDQPTNCVEAGVNQRISTLETADICFPSKNCCVCETSCTYKGVKRQLFEVWQDEETCTRMRCILPETTLRQLGYTGHIAFNELENTDIESVFADLKSSVDFRGMMVDSKIAQNLYSTCQQNITMCPKSIDIGCKPVDTCPECYNTVISQDTCGCDVAECVKVEKCDADLTCPPGHQRYDIEDADPCKAPCFACTCDWCYDNFDNATYDVGQSWKRIYTEPSRCEVCNCSNTVDEKDQCKQEKCAPFVCDVLEPCPEPYNKQNYIYDECGCQVLVSCECTQCMFNGEVLPDKTPGERWTEGDVTKGCYASYYCDPSKGPENYLGCFNVTKQVPDCPTDPKCEGHQVAVKNDNRSCCFEDKCCPRYDCKCVKCRLDDGTFKNPGDEWTTNCVDYVCTDEPDPTDYQNCKLITTSDYKCNDTKPVCSDCYVSYLKTPISIPDQCCEVYDCKPEKYCYKEDGSKAEGGEIINPAPCKRLQCVVTEDDWNNGICPTWVPIDHCDPDPTVCPMCTNRTIVKDECDCDKVECPPNAKPTMCTTPKTGQIIDYFTTDDECFPSKNCCVCDNACMYKGQRKELLSTWWDKSTCKRMRCVLPTTTLAAIGIEEDVDFTNLDDFATSARISNALNYRRMLTDSGIAKSLYTDCAQDPALCPVTREIGCPKPTPCKECEITTESLDSCGCPVISCEPRPVPTSCDRPADNQVVVAMETGDSCFPQRNCCVCQSTCMYNGVEYQPYETWTGDKSCQRFRCVLPNATVTTLGYSVRLNLNDITTRDIQMKFLQMKGALNFKSLLNIAKIPQTLTGDCVQDSSLCPVVYEMPCEQPAECDPCYTRTISQDECGCDVAECTKIERCEPVTCAFPFQATEIQDADECKKPCYECTCNHACVDDLTNSTYEPSSTWQRTVPDPRKCQTCMCTNDIDADGCLKESCTDNPCPAVANCSSPYDFAEYGKDDCGCTILLSCVCTTCMYNGEIIEGRSRGNRWTEGDVERGCYDEYYCKSNKDAGMEKECYNVTKTTVPCVESPPCPVNTVAIKDDDRSCCYGDQCCPQYNCECVVCMMDGVAYNPGQKWSTNCIDYQCTNVTDEMDRKKCKKIINSPTPCNDTREVCEDCYVEYLATKRDPSVEQCCNVYGCQPELVCVKKDGSKVPNGTILTEPCKRFECFVTEADFAEGVCPTLVERNACLNDLTKECPECSNKTIVPDECGCDSVACKPLANPVQCTKTEPFQLLTTLATADVCFPSKNCCICDNTCYYKGGKKELFSVWMDEEACQRMICTPPDSVLTQLGYDPTEIDFKKIENVALWNTIRMKLDYRKLMQDSKTASKIYEQCSQDASLCPTTRDIGCPIPDVCPKCMNTITTNTPCGCPVVTCKNITCEISKPSDCKPPKTVLKSDSSISGNECCPGYCTCPEDCTESETGLSYDRNIVWAHPDNKCYTRTCLVDPAFNEGCPYISNKTICTEPAECDVCFTAVETRDDCDCLQRTCERNPCPKKTCEDECEEVYDTGDQDNCGCPIYGCRPKPCPTVLTNCEDPEKDVYSWMDRSIDKCCKQQGCRCNYTKCLEPSCPVGHIAIRNVSAVKCCCPEYICVPDSTDKQCIDYNGIPRKVGVSWQNKDNHCKMLQCTYSSAKKSSYRIEEFDRFTCFNEKPICNNGETPYLASTKEGCCREWVCPCTCQVYGDPHFTTFDGFSFDYQGKCSYTLMKEYRFNDTEVVVDNELCRWQSARDKSLSCLKTMSVIHRDVNYTFTFGLKFLKDGEEIAARSPWTSPDKDVTVREFGYKQLKIQVHSIDLEIVYKTRLWMQSLILTVPYEKLEGKTLGLCGSCNNDVTDDFRGKDFKLRTVVGETDQVNIDKFGEGWIKFQRDYDEPSCFPDVPDCPTPDVYPDCSELPADECIDCSNKCHLSHTKCSSCESNPCELLSTHPVFKEANAYIDPRVHKAKCAYDLSLESNFTRKCDPCASASVAQYAALNELQGVCVPWRSALGCGDISCPDPSQEYRECDLDAKRDLSCDNPILNVTGSVNVEGCFCPEGAIRRTANSEECIPVKCCGGCSDAPKCQDGSVALPSGGKDGCGCPIYVCSDIEGCVVQETEELFQINIGGKVCTSADQVKTSSCGGNCGVTTTSVNGAIEASCSRCNPVETTTRTVNLSCEDGTKEEYEYDVITSCACAECSSCSGESSAGDKLAPIGMA